MEYMPSFFAQMFISSAEARFKIRSHIVGVIDKTS